MILNELLLDICVAIFIPLSVVTLVSFLFSLLYSMPPDFDTPASDIECFACVLFDSDTPPFCADTFILSMGMFLICWLYVGEPQGLWHMIESVG